MGHIAMGHGATAEAAPPLAHNRKSAIDSVILLLFSTTVIARPLMRSSVDSLLKVKESANRQL